MQGSVYWVMWSLLTPDKNGLMATVKSVPRCSGPHPLVVPHALKFKVEKALGCLFVFHFPETRLKGRGCGILRP